MNRSKFILKVTSSVLVTYVVLILTGFSLIYSVHHIPFEKIKENAEKSAELLQKEGYYDIFYSDYHLPIGEYMQYVLDGWTDPLMIMEACNVGNGKDILETALLNERILLGDKVPCDVVSDLVSDYQHYREKNGTFVYGRYWHGYLVTLIPALTIMDLTQIRLLNFVLFSLLIISIVYLTYKKIGLGTSLFFLATIILGVFIVVPYSLQYSSVFYVSFCSTICLLLFDSILQKKYLAFVFFFAIGSFTSFVDLLTAPIITLGFPLIIYGLLKKESVSFYEIFLLCVMWALGYLLMWSGKWMIAYAITGFDMIGNATHQVNYRIGANENIGVFHVLARVIIRMPTQFKYIFMMALAYWIGAPKNSGKVKKELWLLFVAAVPIVWLLLLKNHTSLHSYMTWRNLYISVFAVLMFVYRTTNNRCIASENKK